MDILEKKKDRELLRKLVQKNAEVAKNNAWNLFMAELSEASKKHKNMELAAMCGVNESQIKKWLDGQGQERFLVESFFKLHYGLDVSPARVLFATNPVRAKAMKAFEFLSGKEFDKLETLNLEQRMTLKNIILGYLKSIPEKPSKNLKNKSK